MEPTTDDGDSLAPGFLVASPKLEGSPFERAVILMVQHDDQGAMGFVINKPVEIDFGTLLESAEQPIAGTIAESTFQQDVLFGGPVRVEQLWVLFNDEGAGARDPGVEHQMGEFEQIAQLAFHRDWVLAGSGAIIEEFATGQRDQPFHPVIGYAGWGPRQLEGEIEEGSWLAIDFEETLIRDTAPEDCWEAALDTVGLDPASFMMMGDGGMA
jgi:putative transcriptional regulator